MSSLFLFAQNLGKNVTLSVQQEFLLSGLLHFNGCTSETRQNDAIADFEGDGRVGGTGSDCDNFTAVQVLLSLLGNINT